MAKFKWIIIALITTVGAVGPVIFSLRAQEDLSELPAGQVFIATDQETYILTVELAATPSARAQGLMYRDQLEENSGMVFLYPQAQDHGPFWMKNTKIPLSIAFFDGKGVIRRILDMEPCSAEPCPTYDPGVAYRGALETNQGWFAEHGIKEGDTIRLEDRLLQQPVTP